MSPMSEDQPTDRGLAIFAAMQQQTERDDHAPAPSVTDEGDGDRPDDGAGTETSGAEQEPETFLEPSAGADFLEPSAGAEQPAPETPPSDDESEPAARPHDDTSDGGPTLPRAPMMPPEATEGLPGGDRLAAVAVAEPAAAAPAAVDGDRRPDAGGHPLPRIMAVANQKGGVGKTTTAVNLAAALAEVGYRTLVVDLDPQGNASTGLGINIRDLQLSMYDVIIHEASIDDTIEATAMKNLFVAPASLDLAGAEIELVPAFSRELRLRHALAEVSDDYDYVLIDCPPSLGLLTVNGFAAAGEVLVPIQCEYYALEGLGQLLRNVALVQRNLNQTLEVSTFVCVMYDARTKLADQVVSEVRNHFGDKVCRIVVPRTVRLSEAPSYGQPILAFDPRSRGAIAYRELAREISGGAR